MKFLGLDDDAGTEPLKVIENKLRRELGCEFNVVHPENFQTLLDVVAGGNWDGILLDLRLNVKGGSGERFPHLAPTVAQDLRTKMTAGDIRDVPIVLWSADDIIGKYYDSDSTSHDLFDWTLRKGREDGAGARLVALAAGYISIMSAKSMAEPRGESLLAVSSDKWDTLPSDLRAELKYLLKKRPVHEVASFLLNQVLLTPGLIVSERLLRTRLGLMASDDECWSEVVGALRETEYSGAFAGFGRWWWWPWVIRKLADLDERTVAIRTLNSQARIPLMVNALRLNTACASRSGERRDWYICEDKGVPIPPSEAYLLAPSPSYSWQEGRFVSFEGLADSEGDQGFRLAPGEWERYKDDEEPEGADGGGQ